MNHNKVDSTSVNLNPFGSWKRSNCDVSSVEEFNGPGKNVFDAQHCKHGTFT